MNHNTCVQYPSFTNFHVTVIIHPIRCKHEIDIAGLSSNLEKFTAFLHSSECGPTIFFALQLLSNVIRYSSEIRYYNNLDHTAFNLSVIVGEFLILTISGNQCWYIAAANEQILYFEGTLLFFDGRIILTQTIVYL